MVDAPPRPQSRARLIISLPAPAPAGAFSHLQYKRVGACIAGWPPPAGGQVGMGERAAHPPGCHEDRGCCVGGRGSGVRGRSSCVGSRRIGARTTETEDHPGDPHRLTTSTLCPGTAWGFLVAADNL